MGGWAQNYILLVEVQKHQRHWVFSYSFNIYVHVNKANAALWTSLPA
jgi:hypothetical protein